MRSPYSAQKTNRHTEKESPKIVKLRARQSNMPSGNVTEKYNLNFISLWKQERVACYFRLYACCFACCPAVVLLVFCGMLCGTQEDHNGNKPFGFMHFHPLSLWMHVFTAVLFFFFFKPNYQIKRSMRSFGHSNEAIANVNQINFII